MNEAEQILYDCTGMLGENHPSIIEAMDKYAIAKIKDRLEKYNQFLLKNGYTDTDIYQEEPTAIDQFLTIHPSI